MNKLQRAWYIMTGRAERVCEAVGHDATTVFRRGYRKSDYDDYLHVARSLKQKRQKCKRCSKYLTEWETVQDKGLSSLTLSGDLADVYNDKGEVWI